MSYVIATPETMTAAAAELATIGSSVEAAHLAAAPATLALAPAAADEVSTAIASLFSGHARDYQTTAGRAVAFQAQFVDNLKSSAVAYTSIEDAIVSLLQGLRTGINSVATAYFAAVLGSFGWIPVGQLSPLLQAILIDLPVIALVGIPFFGFLFALGLVNGLIALITG